MHVCVSVSVCCLCVRFRFWFGLFGRDLYSSARSVAHKYNTIFCCFLLCFRFALFLYYYFAVSHFLLPPPPKKAQTHFCLLRYVVAPTEPNRLQPIIINNNFRQLGPSSSRERRRRRRTYGRVGSGRIGRRS